MFQGLRQGALLYVLDKRKPSLEIAQVVTISNPMPKYNATANMYGTFEQVVDISVMTSSGQVDYKQVPALLSVANFGTEGVVLSDNKDAMASEIEAMCRVSQAHLSAVPFHQQVLTKRDEMMMKLNPEAMKAKQQEQEIANLNEKIAKMADVMSRMEAMLAKSEKQTKKE